jgi:hypothetical protein
MARWSRRGRGSAGRTSDARALPAKGKLRCDQALGPGDVVPMTAHVDVVARLVPASA